MHTLKSFVKLSEIFRLKFFVSCSVFAISLFLSNGCLKQRMYVQYSSSMEPTIPRGSKMSVSPHAYVSQPPRRWELIVFNPPMNENAFFAMRVVGLPGETIQFHGKRFLVDGKVISIPQELSHLVFSSHFDQIVAKEKPYQIPSGHVFVLGDNSEVANDSRFWGALDQSLILGRINKVECPELGLGVQVNKQIEGIND